MQSEPNEHKVIDLQLGGCLFVEDGNHGEYRPRPNEFGSGDTAFIRAADMEGGRILFDSADKINDVALARIRKGIGRGGDILFSHKGTVGKLAVAPMDAPPFVCSPQTTFWRTLDEDRLDRRYLYYFMCSRRFREQWHSRKGETDMADYVSLTAQRELVVVVPHIDEQRAVGRILGALDDKIELNRQMNRTLETLAQALFKSWFVDFDPVTAKAAGRKPYGMTEATAVLFPDRFVESELGLIPEGWRIGTLRDVTGFLNGFAFKSSDWVEAGVPVVKIGSVKPGIINLSDVSYVSEDVARQATRFRLKVGDLLIGMTGYVGEVGMVPSTDNPPLLNQRVGKFVLSNSGLSTLPFVYCLTRNPDFKAEVEAKAHGTAQANVSSDSILSIKTVLPDTSLGVVFSNKYLPMLEKILSNVAEAETLAALRDALLPKLLSGEVRVRQAENLVAEAV